ncbi:TonB-dependent receptor [Sinorhizobium sp. BG8]|uniref:TonB-dependent siderophore receptor n=1 Tax=Sinorhizobium sp. BG8 TaxID=2613773 RepID=UPI00193D49D2|nr:TonB-dependent receptor [Sinorhizobium sp. BG8]QRM54360.1 TonB-dependent siderophore receptor [Sinorhizobium sp. BG8]
MRKQAGDRIFTLTTRRRRRGLLGSVAVHAVTAAAFVLAGAGASVAQEVKVNRSERTPVGLNIPAQDLGTALTVLADRTGLKLLFPSQLVSGKTSNAVAGSYSREQALSQMLAGSGLSYKFTSGNTVTISGPQQAVDGAAADGSTALEAITVQGLGASTEGTNSYTTGQMSTGTKLPLSIRETPQSVSVVTQQRIKDKNYETLDQALQDATGVTAMQGFGDTRWEYFARGGLISNIQYDGVSSPINLFTRDVLVQDNLAIYDRVEIVRGASGLTEGSGNPAASVNLVRKHATATPQYSAETSVSSFGNAQATLDASGPLNEAGTLRGRFVASGGAGDGYRDYFEQKNVTLYGVIDADITEDTTVSLGVSYQKENTDGYTWGGLPSREDGSFYNFSPETYLGSDWEYLKKTQSTVYLDVEHRFDNDWKLNASARRIWADSDMLSSFIWRFAGDVRKNDRLYDYDDDQHSLDVHVSGPVELFGREHDVVVGVSAQREKFSYVGGSSPFYVIDPENWDPTSVPKPDITVGSFAGDLDQKEAGIYASTRLDITDSFKIILGGRLSWYSNNDVYSDDEYTADGQFIPYVGAVYDLNDTFSVYGSYTEIFLPQMAYGIDGTLLDPAVGDNKEVGIKGEFLDGRLNASVALFETNQTGLATELTDVIYCNPSAYTCYEAADKVRTRGVELEVTGAVTPNLNLGFGYTYSESKYVKGENSGLRYNTEKSPAHLFKLSAAYQLPGEYENWTIGAGVRAQSKTYYQGETYRIEQPAYAVADAMARYTFNEKTVLQLNVNNMFDKEYYSSISGLTSYGHFIGAPREFVLSLRHSF